MLRTVRRDAARGLTHRKRGELIELARRFQSARRSILAEYSSPAYALAILTADRRLIEQRRQRGWPSLELSPHQNKVCLESAIGTLRSQWHAAIGRAVRDVSSIDSWRQDRAWALTTLRSVRLIGALLADAPSGAVERRCARLRRLVLRHRGRAPRPSGRLWFELDSNLYRVFLRPEDKHFRGAWIAITGITRGHRVNVPLAGSSISDFGSRTGRAESRPNVRIVVDEAVTIYVTAIATLPPRSGFATIGIDQGLRTLAVVSAGDPSTAVGYGDGFGHLVGAVMDSYDERRRQRQRITSYERSLRNSSPRAARRVRRRNLGGRKFERRGKAERARLRTFVNRTLNDLFRDNPSVAAITCEDLSFWRLRAIPRLNRVLGRWLKGYVSERLRYKAELNGVELNVVNAAYTSQSCPACWFTSILNRRGDTFFCVHCGFTGSADAIAATNVLRRGSDPAITRFMRATAVKQILDERWRSASIGRAWDSNAAARGLDGLADNAVDRVANRSSVACSRQSGPYGGALSDRPPVLSLAAPEPPRGVGSA